MIQESPPVARCPTCGAATSRAQDVNQRGNTRGCRGRFGRALQPTDWQLCPACQGQRAANGSRCTACDGMGWIYVSQGPK